MKSFIMPAIVSQMQDALIVQWLKKAGDPISVGDPIVEIETEKAIAELQSDCEGVIVSLEYEEGDVVPVGACLGWIREAAENTSPHTTDSAEVAESLDTDITSDDSLAEERIIPFAPLEQIQKQEQIQVQIQEQTAQQQQFHEETCHGELARTGTDNFCPPTLVPMPVLSRRGSVKTASAVKISAVIPEPPDKTIATDKTIAPDKVIATDTAEVIRNSDIRNSEPQQVGNALQTSVVDMRPEYTREPMSMQRRTIARRMALSASTIPQVTLSRKADITELIKLRQKLQRFSQTKASLNDFILRAIAMAVAAHPQINSCLDGNDVLLFKHVNLAFAVDVKGALYVPVIHDADTKSLQQLAVCTRRLIDLANKGQLSITDSADPTFTVTNVGLFGIEYFNPLILPPQTGILGVGAVVDEPVWKDNLWQAHKRVGLSYTFDHRVIDGALGGRFLQTLADLLENPLELIWTEEDTGQEK